jgi:hypothetical protein
MTHLHDELLRAVHDLAPDIDARRSRAPDSRAARIDRAALTTARLAIGLVGLLVLTPALIAMRMARRT